MRKEQKGWLPWWVVLLGAIAACALLELAEMATKWPLEGFRLAAVALAIAYAAWNLPTRRKATQDSGQVGVVTKNNTQRDTGEACKLITSPTPPRPAVGARWLITGVVMLGVAAFLVSIPVTVRSWASLTLPSAIGEGPLLPVAALAACMGVAMAVAAIARVKAPRAVWGGAVLALVLVIVSASYYAGLNLGKARSEQELSKSGLAKFKGKERAREAVAIGVLLQGSPYAGTTDATLLETLSSELGRRHPSREARLAMASAVRIGEFDDLVVKAYAVRYQGPEVTALVDALMARYGSIARTKEPASVPGWALDPDPWRLLRKAGRGLPNGH